MSRFKALKEQQAQAEKRETAPTPALPKSRGKMIAGYFSEALSLEIKQIALTDKTTVQALIGEGLDAVLRARGKHPFGER